MLNLATWKAIKSGKGLDYNVVNHSCSNVVGKKKKVLKKKCQREKKPDFIYIFPEGLAFSSAFI